MHRFKELKIWQKAMDVAVMTYNLTKLYPSEDRFGLTSQSRRAAVSIPSNIAEGAGRRSNAEFANFLNISNGSTSELETQVILAERLDFITQEQAEPILKELEQLQNMNYALVKTVTDKSKK